jgi:hypothetical protein
MRKHEQLHDQFHILLVLDTRFCEHIRAEQQNWDEILLEHLLLCKVEEELNIKENE